MEQGHARLERATQEFSKAAELQEATDSLAQVQSKLKQLKDQAAEATVDPQQLLLMLMNPRCSRKAVEGLSIEERQNVLIWLMAVQQQLLLLQQLLQTQMPAHGTDVPDCVANQGPAGNVVFRFRGTATVSGTT